VHWFKLGGENTKFFFHSKATQRYRHNKIAEIRDEDGSVLLIIMKRLMPSGRATGGEWGCPFLLPLLFRLVRLFLHVLIYLH
jgi:hypothetical protein